MSGHEEADQSGVPKHGKSGLGRDYGLPKHVNEEEMKSQERAQLADLGANQSGVPKHGKTGNGANSERANLRVQANIDHNRKELDEEMKSETEEQEEEY